MNNGKMALSLRSALSKRFRAMFLLHSRFRGA
jgi:hypothetical protein